MNDKIALVSCSGLSPLGLVVRAASVELALENENIVAACITEYSAQPNNCSPILDDAKIVTITGCGDDCASVILKDKNIAAVKNISLDHVVKAYELNPLDAVRLDEDGEKAVVVLKKYILKELENI
ncbi:DGC domain-containing protein [Methanobrevibacter gottschalkii]|uniref:DGC domain-containing protein n=2 Tax=Methanobrevibacter gottschalkii TaxID=190974 RepID=A0A3N5B6X4_9EURY|nr:MULTISPECIES: putative zinc-binding protein [Methanobrevibacter]MCQ2970332.1 putative zinc-binding protein [archaeon]OEC95264.1 metal-binding protein [Methanobrevibacter sp. A27]RPF53113.1 DGC domain-containing protein [Methanobrevibacter gottschalkii DSM 11977]SEK61111.1 DGC domain-containing protein [Methanobrevibacter gottschalkii]